jgi:hypothetical protein
MGHRRFKDGGGRDWDVWSVMPTKVERRTLDLSKGSGDRRAVHEFRAHLGPELSAGWLCFETKDEKRRLAPYPKTWETLSDVELEALLATARRSPRPRRLTE